MMSILVLGRCIISFACQNVSNKRSFRVCKTKRSWTAYVSPCTIKTRRWHAWPPVLTPTLHHTLTPPELTQLLFLYTCRAHPILADFVCDVYWERYTAGQECISNADAQVFVIQAMRDGKTQRSWSENTIKNVASYLTGCCADYGLLERGQKSARKILPCLLES